MKLSFSTNAFVRYSVFEAVEAIAALGYEAVELLADAPHLYADGATPWHLRELKAVLDGSGLDVANVNANTAVGYYGRSFWEPLFEPSISNPDPRERRWRIDYTKKCIDMAHFLGSPNISVTSGRMVPGCHPEHSMRLLLDSLDELLGYAAQSGVRVGIEYEPCLLIESHAELLDLLRQMDSPFLGANLDLGHSHVLAEDPETVIRGLSSKLFHVHIEDIRARKHYHLIPGTGDVDFARLLKLLDACNYEGALTVELYTYPQEPGEAARKSLEYFQDLMVKGNLRSQKEGK